MTEEVSRIDEALWPGPDYSPVVFEGNFPHGNQANPHDLYQSALGGWYEYKRAGTTSRVWPYDWIRIKNRPEEADW